jgi:hypothetical protein
MPLWLADFHSQSLHINLRITLDTTPPDVLCRLLPFTLAIKRDTVVLFRKSYYGIPCLQIIGPLGAYLRYSSITKLK